MAKRKVPQKSAAQIAAELADIRNRKDALIELDRVLTAALKEALHAAQIDRAGNYKLSKVVTLKVVEPELAFGWAATANCLKVDTVKAKEVLRHTFDDPEKFGFAKVETESIRPIKSNNHEE